MKHTLPILLCFLFCSAAKAQTNIICTNPAAEQMMRGNYPHTGWYSTNPPNYDDTISRGLNARVSPDSLHDYLDVLRSFRNRNTGSDTISNTRGIGAARRWVYNKFQDFSAREGGRLLPAYLQFDLNICSINQHRDIFAVLPGSDTNDKSVVIVEGHIDSRCAGLCDTSCLAEGMEDNGSGTALVLELARVMSHYKYRRTIVFLVVTGEEQGLYGGKAFADYTVQKGIKVHAVFNDDVIGGIICGQTSSPPSCPGLNNIDSTNVRLFSYGTFNSAHKQLARFVKLEYKDQLLPYVSVPMTINIMNDEDRIGRGGDHIPFRQDGITAIRFTSANEHGDANVTASGYSDRQHTSSDILGIDRDNNGSLDSFFVDFNYLTRNAVINGNAVAMAAIGPQIPAFTVNSSGYPLYVNLTQQTNYPNYRVALRTVSNDWDTLFTFSGAGPFTLRPTPGLSNIVYEVSVASVDSAGVESLFSNEAYATVGVKNVTNEKPSSFELLQNKPNPFDETTTISVLVRDALAYKEAYISIADAVTGKEVKRLPIDLKQGIAEVIYKHGYHATGTYVYSLVIDGRKVDSRKMVFAN
jgi:hypothetical protein